MTVYRKWLIDLPHVENLHASIHAFLRTSDYGTWEVDPSVTSDSFVLNYRRGQELPRPPGKTSSWLRGTYYEEEVAQSKWPGEHQPLVRLRVTLRPTSAGIRIGIEWELLSQYAELYRKIAGERLTKELETEFQLLADYLADCFHLEETPRLTSDNDVSSS
jgi:hypothetical protein